MLKAKWSLEVAAEFISPISHFGSWAVLNHDDESGSYDQGSFGILQQVCYFIIFAQVVFYFSRRFDILIQKDLKNKKSLMPVGNRDSSLSIQSIQELNFHSNPL